MFVIVTLIEFYCPPFPCWLAATQYYSTSRNGLKHCPIIGLVGRISGLGDNHRTGLQVHLPDRQGQHFRGKRHQGEVNNIGRQRTT